MLMIVDSALSEVPVNFAPLIDSGDFVTIEDAVAYDAAGMDLVWNFVSVSGAFTQTAVTPTTGGAHDWTAQGNGMYTLEIPASGGTINNDAEGYGWFTGVCDGVLPWAGPKIQFSPANVVNALVVGSDKLQVDATEINSVAAAAARLALSAGQIIPGTVDDTVSPTTTQFEAGDITEATADHFGGLAGGNGRIILWTTGALTGQVASISDYALVSGRGRFTVPEMTESPADGDTFVII